MLNRSEIIIIPLTYGVIPVAEPQFNYTYHTLSTDSRFAAIAAAERAKDLVTRGKRVRVFIPGATFYGSVSDSEKMAQLISRRNPDVDVLAISYCLNTPSQMAEIAKLNTPVEIICASWQEKDAKTLMEGHKVEGVLTTDKKIFLDYFPNSKKTFDILEGSTTFKLKQDGLQAKAFELLNKLDKKGQLRIILSKILGVGVAHWDYRGLEREANKWALSRANKIMSTRKYYSYVPPRA